MSADYEEMRQQLIEEGWVRVSRYTANLHKGLLTGLTLDGPGVVPEPNTDAVWISPKVHPSLVKVVHDLTA